MEKITDAKLIRDRASIAFARDRGELSPENAKHLLKEALQRFKERQKEKQDKQQAA